MKNSIPSTHSKTRAASRIKKGALLFLFPLIAFSQGIKTAGYRNIKAYADDFAKNEMYIKKSLIEYSESIIENHLGTRSQATANRILGKLRNINQILEKNDIGFQGNTDLRDSFMRMNARTIDCMSNGSLILNDYQAQTQFDVCTIEKNTSEKQAQLLGYFEELKNYDQTKLAFGARYNMEVHDVVCDNLFEYNAKQNLLFYKINVLDQKLIASINSVNQNDFMDCIYAYEKLYSEVLEKTAQYKDVYKDNSLNDATLGFAHYIRNQNTQISPLFNDFAAQYEAFQHLKNQPTTTPEALQAYNDAVRVYNYKKNKLFDTLAGMQHVKKTLYHNWYKTNRNFLKYNSKFDDIHQNNITYAE